MDRKPGEWTVNTAMALALAESLLAHPEFGERDFLSYFVDWRQNGAYSYLGALMASGRSVAPWERSGIVDTSVVAPSAP